MQFVENEFDGLQTHFGGWSEGDEDWYNQKHSRSGGETFVAREEHATKVHNIDAVWDEKNGESEEEFRSHKEWASHTSRISEGDEH